MKRGVMDKDKKPFVRVWSVQQVRRFADILQSRLTKRSFAWQKRALVVYSLVALCTSAAVSYWSLVHPSTSAIEVVPIKILPALPPAVPASIISKEEYQRIHHWRLQLDSMDLVNRQNHTALKATGTWTLRDSLLYLEDLYQQQFK